jgi:hypothetical protein
LENDRCKSDLTIAQFLLINYHPSIPQKDSVTETLLEKQ